MKFLILFILVVLYSLYKRYFPVIGIGYLKSGQIKIVDVRDFNESYKNPIQGATKIPVAYLKRNLNEISDSKIHVVGSNKIDKNVAIRFLKQKGFNVKGYTIIN